MTEAQFHKQVADYLSAQLHAPTIWSTIPAGGGGLIRGANLKKRGLKRGWPDILVIHPFEDDASIVLGLELKTKKGTLSEDQKIVQLQFMNAGANYCACRTIEDVKGALKGVGIL